MSKSLKEISENIIALVKREKVIGAGNTLENRERTGGWSEIVTTLTNSTLDDYQYEKKEANKFILKSKESKQQEKHTDTDGYIAKRYNVEELLKNKRYEPAKNLIHKTMPAMLSKAGNCGDMIDSFMYLASKSADLRGANIFPIYMRHVEHAVIKIVTGNETIIADPWTGISFSAAEFDKGIRIIFNKLMEEYNATVNEIKKNEPKKEPIVRECLCDTLKNLQGYAGVANYFLQQSAGSISPTDPYIMQYSHFFLSDEPAIFDTNNNPSHPIYLLNIMKDDYIRLVDYYREVTILSSQPVKNPTMNPALKTEIIHQYQAKNSKQNNSETAQPSYTANTKNKNNN
jgi:hypothetical protein